MINKMKINKKKKCIEIFLFLGIFSIMFCSLVGAVSVGNTYSDNRPLEVYPGQEVDFKLSLQNRAGDNDVNFKAEIVEGIDIATLMDSSDEYFVPADPESETWVNIRVGVPKNVGIGEEYGVRIRFDPLASDISAEGSGATIALALSEYFKVKVIEKPVETLAPEKISAIWWVLGIVAIVLIIVVIWFMAKNKKESVK